MKAIIKVFFWLIAVVVILLLVGFFLPKNVKIERTATINAKPEAVYALLNDLTTYDKWMPWNQLDPQWKVEYSPQTSGAGAWYKWDSKNDKVGKGQLSIIESNPGDKVVAELKFEGFSEPSASGWILKPAGTGTELTWYMNSNIGNSAIYRWMGIFMDKMMGPQFEKGLQNIAVLADKGALTVTSTKKPTIIIADTTTAKQIIAYVTDSAASTAAVTQKFMTIIPVDLGGFLKKQSLQMMGAPCAWYNSTHPPFVFDIGVPVSKAVAAEGRVKIKELAAGKAVVAHFYGPYDLTGKAYTLVNAYIKQQNKIANGAPYEVYLGDPGVEKDPYKVLTNIVFPVK